MNTRLLMILRVMVALRLTLETAAPKYGFHNCLLAVGIGQGGRDGPVHTIEEILGRRVRSADGRYQRPIDLPRRLWLNGLVRIVDS